MGKRFDDAVNKKHNFQRWCSENDATRMMKQCTKWKRFQTITFEMFQENWENHFWFPLILIFHLSKATKKICKNLTQ